jgi:hypothetical protein
VRRVALAAPLHSLGQPIFASTQELALLGPLDATESLEAMLLSRGLAFFDDFVDINSERPTVPGWVALQLVARP